MPIQILPDRLVARIAAGEVVERPAAVVKELVENAIDAGATEIRVECAEGGRRLMRITDNGHGIRKDEVALAFTHHATSKLVETDDLAHILTLGFRGEALASVASVSQVTCVTRHRDETVGTLLRIDNGTIVTEESIGRPVGTTMTIEHLFARVPARLKFLKAKQTERGHIDGVVMRYAMAYPHIRFMLSHDGKMSFQTTGNGQLRDVLIEVYGADSASKFVTVETADDGRRTTDDSPVVGRPSSVISVAGFAALPQFDHSNRTKITLFVNGRPVQDAKLSYAVVQAYHTMLMVGRYPVGVILVQVPPDDVDVNVHPAKAEVRFRDADGVFSAIQRAVRRTLLTHMPVPEPPSVFEPSTWLIDRAAPNSINTGPAGLAGPEGLAGIQVSPSPEGIADQPSNAPFSLPAGLGEPDRPHPAPQPALAGTELWNRVGIAKQGEFVVPQPQWQTHAPQPRQPSFTHSNLPALRILGQLALTYIIAEGPEGLYLIDQHAAHERILFEKMLAERELGAVASQALLDPVPVDVAADSAYLLEAQLPMLQDLGFEIDHFGGNTFLVRVVPALMGQDDIVNAVRQIVADLEMNEAPLRKDLEARVLRRVCKRMAIKAGRVLSFAEMAALVRDLEACESPRTCPHGRPTIIQLSVGQLEKEFGRLG